MIFVFIGFATSKLCVYQDSATDRCGPLRISDRGAYSHGLSRHLSTLHLYLPQLRISILSSGQKDEHVSVALVLIVARLQRFFTIEATRYVLSSKKA